jgi:hypothetical protein
MKRVLATVAVVPTALLLLLLAIFFSNVSAFVSVHTAFSYG